MINSACIVLTHNSQRKFSANAKIQQVKVFQEFVHLSSKTSIYNQDFHYQLVGCNPHPNIYIVISSSVDGGQDFLGMCLCVDMMQFKCGLGKHLMACHVPWQIPSVFDLVERVKSDHIELGGVVCVLVSALNVQRFTKHLWKLAKVTETLAFMCEEHYFLHMLFVTDCI